MSSVHELNCANVPSETSIGEVLELEVVFGLFNTKLQSNDFDSELIEPCQDIYRPMEMKEHVVDTIQQRSISTRELEIGQDTMQFL
jgi:hypothetical protein